MIASLFRRPAGLDVSWVAASALVAVAFGFGVGVQPTVALLVGVGLIFGAFVLVSPRLRLSLVVFGGVLTLESAQTFSALKLAYLLGVAGAVLGAMLGLEDPIAMVARTQLRPLFRISAALVALVSVSLVQAFVNGTSPVAWLRDAAAYLLLAAVPLLALDASARISRQWLVGSFVLAGTLASLSFSVAWLERRHLAPLPIDRLLFPSAGLAIGFVCYAFAKAQQASVGRTRWAVLGGVLLALLLVTGTRTNLLVLAAPLAMVLANRRDPGRLVRFFGRVGLAVLIAVVAWTLVGKVANVNLNRAGERLTSVTRVTSDPVASQSLTERVIQSRLAWRTFTSKPFGGAGPGHLYVWSDQFGLVHSGYTMDTSLLFLAKFGLLGAGLVLFGIYSVREFIRSLGVRRRGESARLALVGYSTFWLLSLPLGLPLEDKGFGLALLLLLALVIVEGRVARSETE